jgi:hypothetical protein
MYWFGTAVTLQMESSSNRRTFSLLGRQAILCCFCNGIGNAEVVCTRLPAEGVTKGGQKEPSRATDVVATANSVISEDTHRLAIMVYQSWMAMT